LIRIATISDIPELQIVRNSVKENKLSSSNRIKDADVEEYLLSRGKGWVTFVDGKIIGFAIADLIGHSIWALFLLPEYEGRGYGRQLHQAMLDWYFSESREKLWLTTGSNTRAENFYKMHGWTEVSRSESEIKFEMSYDEWIEYKMSENG